MTFEEFFGAMLRPVYVVQMARGLRSRDGVHTARTRSAETRYQRARRQIDDLVLQRADTIRDERRCAALYQVGVRVPATSEEPEEPVHVRCEYQREHGRVPGRTPRSGARVDTGEYDHGAPSAGIWWNGEGTQG